MSKTIVIIGASRGIGLAVVEQLAKDPKNKIIALARSFREGQPFSNLQNVNCHHLDLASTTLRSELEAIVSGLNSIDILINNAGYIIVKPFLELSREEIQLAYQINVIGVMESIQACLPKMKTGSHIVNISSMGGFQGSVKFSGLSAYSTSKAAVASLTELLAEELKETGIKINCLCLGSVQTEMLEMAFPGYIAPLTASEMAVYISDFSLNAHKYMNGKIIPVSLTTP